MQTILATLDGSDFSKEIIGVLSRLFGGHDAEVHLVTVSSTPTSQQRGSGQTGTRPGAGAVDSPGLSPANLLPPNEPTVIETGEQAIARVVAEDRDMLESAAAALRTAGLKVTCDVLLDENPADAIAGLARGLNVDLIAMATHGRGGIGRLLQGSVATKVLASGAAPVLLVRPTGV